MYLIYTSETCEIKISNVSMSEDLGHPVHKITVQSINF